MICPKCHFEQDDGRTECAGCGVIFAKVKAASPERGEPLVQAVEPDISSVTVKTLFFPIPVDPNPLVITCKGVLLLLLAIWSLKFIFASIESNIVGGSFMHLVNLPFHEAGHLIFSPLGRFVQVLGGTLGQLLMPAICMAVLLIRTRDAFGAAVAMWWLAESFMDIAPYINDARALKLILLGGVTGRDVVDYHDWEYILRHLGMLRMDHALAWMAQAVGIVLMISALLWAGANLWVQFKTYQRYDHKIA